jgi:hypothetical protein
VPSLVPTFAASGASSGISHSSGCWGIQCRLVRERTGRYG